MSKLQWCIIILMLIVFGAIGIRQIATTRKLQQVVEEYEKPLEQKQPRPKQVIEPLSVVKEFSEGHDARNDESQASFPEADMSADEQTSSEKPPDSAEFISEETMAEATRPQASKNGVEEASSEYKAFMERHRNFLDTYKEMQAEADEVLASVIPEIVSALNAMDADEQKAFINQMKAMGWTQAQEAGDTNLQGFDDSVDSFVNMLKDKGFHPRY